ncbi:MAG: branched-chain amino acid transport system substrate-binding protein [Gaiellaceae bacterium]|nr:branched-chain amino acid transport system substrate-binding protein [Gaiellaceae bacterium]
MLAALALAACSGGGSPNAKKFDGTLLIAVNAPFSRTPSVGQRIERGVKLAVDTLNTTGVVAGSKTYRLRVEVLDNGLSPARAVRNVRRAIRDGAVAIVDEGTGVDASWRVADAAHVPLCIVYQGGQGLVDPERRPNVFRIAPTDHGISFRLAEYLVPKGLKIAFLTDDSDYGRQGLDALRNAFRTTPKAVAVQIELPASATDVAPQVLQARRSGATALLVWAQSPVVAQTISAARSSGWHVPIYTAASGEDPLVRQELADQPRWVDGLTFAAGRMTAEGGPGPFLDFQARYAATYGRERVGVKGPTGLPVVSPPDYAMYPYDFVNVLAVAVTAAKSTDRSAILRQLNEVSVRGANGDERGFNFKNHEGVVDDDVYFARFRDMVYSPVKDDPLSSTLPMIAQEVR